MSKEWWQETPADFVDGFTESTGTHQTDKQDELFPPRKGGHVNPQDSVNEVLDTIAAVGWAMPRL